jgi:glutathione S-transferase
MKPREHFCSYLSCRARIALNLKGLAVDYIPRRLRQGEQRDHAHLAFNPRGLFSVLVDDGEQS